MRAIIIVLGLVGAAALAGCQAAPEPTPESVVVDRFTDALSAKNVDAMLSWTHPDIELKLLAGDETLIEARGRDQFRAAMTAYVQSRRELSVKVVGALSTPGLTATRERLSWIDPSGDEAFMHSVVVYEVEDDLVRRIWRYRRPE